MNPGRAEQDGDQRQRHQACGDAEDQGNTAANLGNDGQIGEDCWQAEAFKEGHGSRNGENVHLQQAVCEEQHTGGNAQNEGCIVGVGISVHVRSLSFEKVNFDG